MRVCFFFLLIFCNHFCHLKEISFKWICRNLLLDILNSFNDLISIIQGSWEEHGNWYLWNTWRETFRTTKFNFKITPDWTTCFISATMLQSGRTRTKTQNQFSGELDYNLQVLASQVELVCTGCRGEGALAQTLVQEQVPQQSGVELLLFLSKTEQNKNCLTIWLSSTLQSVHDNCLDFC